MANARSIVLNVVDCLLPPFPENIAQRFYFCNKQAVQITEQLVPAQNGQSVLSSVVQIPSDCSSILLAGRGALRRQRSVVLGAAEQTLARLTVSQITDASAHVSGDDAL
jgi:hypothetical protein